MTTNPVPSPARLRRPRPEYWLALLMLAITFAGALLTAARPVDATEARLLWIVRDVQPVKPAGPRDVARHTLTNIRTMLDRAQTNGYPLPVYPAVLDGWTMLVGDYAETARWLPALLVVIALAAAYATLRGLQLPALPLLALTGGPLLLLAAQPAAGMLPVTVGLLLLAGITRRGRRRAAVRRRDASGAVLLLSLLLLVGQLLPVVGWLNQVDPAADWQATLATYCATRDPLHPAVINFPPDSVPGYYDYRYRRDGGLRGGIALDVGWREFSGDEISTLMDTLIQSGLPVWLVLDNQPVAEQVRAALIASGYTMGYSRQVAAWQFSAYHPPP